MLAHAALHRAAQVARVLASENCPLVIHVDRRVGAVSSLILCDLYPISITSTWHRAGVVTGVPGVWSLPAEERPRCCLSGTATFSMLR